MKKLLLAMALGAALAWLLDPDTGSRRRESLRRTLDERGLTRSSSTPTNPPALVDSSRAAAAQ